MKTLTLDQVLINQIIKSILKIKLILKSKIW